MTLTWCCTRFIKQIRGNFNQIPHFYNIIFVSKWRNKNVLRCDVVWSCKFICKYNGAPAVKTYFINIFITVFISVTTLTGFCPSEEQC